jgi:23S rRNA-/tRNA-specific pseudouridylate synthase
MCGRETLLYARCRRRRSQPQSHRFACDNSRVDLGSTCLVLYHVVLCVTDSTALLQDIPLDIVFEDEHLLVINKVTLVTNLSD